MPSESPPMDPNPKKRRLGTPTSPNPPPSSATASTKTPHRPGSSAAKNQSSPPTKYRASPAEHKTGFAGRPPPQTSRPRSPSPPRSRSRSRSRSPPRKRKRPGATARVGREGAPVGASARREEERREALRARGVHDAVRQHYNNVPQRGKEWRRTDSKIKGLRSFNNWCKSALIQKFAAGYDYGWGAGAPPKPHILVLDIGCGKGGDLQKWQSCPAIVDLYVGLDPAEISIEQARDRYRGMTPRNQHNNNNRRHHQRRLFEGRFLVKDCFGESLDDIPVIREVGFDPTAGPGGAPTRWTGGGGFDVVSMMFCMHYAFESENKARRMLKNVAGALKKGGRFLGVIPNSDVLSEKVEAFHLKLDGAEAGAKAGNSSTNPAEYDSDDDWDPEKSLDVDDEPPPAAAQPPPPPTAHAAEDEKKDKEDGEVEQQNVLEWGNSIYKVRFPGQTPKDGVFRPPFGWKYFYFLEEAVEEVPEYVVPWEAFRALAEDYNLELQYRRPFNEIWEDNKNDRVLGDLSERMGVRDRDRGPLRVTKEELDAASFYHAFCFYKV
ncbi:mRNA capping enzyme-domain-containing protein [Lineolata rhizophorae]|uniref:mRNA cap guanine-N(7) methyltransferase n=1 Tax=Lineolata rhizophorae TaxID=578093 RepID=A0A6A6NPS9_9PEZI|nr:mRNA capping enzyme-domain-containing protein [Lineolata rhizophorae]